MIANFGIVNNSDNSAWTPPCDNSFYGIERLPGQQNFQN